ncbi:MAG: hypothetical protein ABH835_01655 [Patescibacteria group bacterium]|nr:hypothetical protein [Patescibacteria group bacterium]
MRKNDQYHNGHQLTTQHGVSILIEILDDERLPPGKDFTPHLRVTALPDHRFEVVLENPGVSGLDNVPTMMRQCAGASFVAADFGMKGTCQRPRQDTLAHLVLALDEHLRIKPADFPRGMPHGNAVTSLGNLGDLLADVKLD